VLDTVEHTTSYLSYKQTPLLMRNTGKGFVNVSTAARLTEALAARGAAFGDIDNDGDVDVIVAQTNGAPVLLQNNGTRNHWLGISLAGTKSNRQGLGARVTVTDLSGGKQIFDVSTAGSYLSSSDARIIAGLGAKTGVKSVEVRWPSGIVQSVSNPAIDKYLTITESNLNE
jgi:enediyne biosynthesis protein E4